MSDPYSAYQDLMTALVVRRPDQSVAEDERIVLAALAKHAHELAERQRAHVRRQAGDPFHYGSAQWAVVGVDEAADLIDPQRPVVGVRQTKETT